MRNTPGDCLHRMNSTGVIDAWDCEASGGDYESVVYSHYSNNTIVSVVDGWCLTAETLNVVTKPCSNASAPLGTIASQNFTVDSLGRISPASDPSKCISVNLSSPEPTPHPGGYNVIGDTCKVGSTKQMWTIMEQEGGNATVCTTDGTTSIQRCLAVADVATGGSHGPNLVAAASNDTGVVRVLWALDISGGNTTITSGQTQACLGQYKDEDCNCINLTHSQAEPEPGINAELW